MKKPVLPYVLKDSKYCGERPNCKASMEQARLKAGSLRFKVAQSCQVSALVPVLPVVVRLCDAWKARGKQQQQH